jgi:hypothetical protein
MQMETGTRILKALLVLLLGGKVPDGAAPAGIDLRAFGPPRAPVCAEIDLSRLRELVAGSADLTKLVYEDRDRTAAVGEAAAFVGLAVRAEPDYVKQVFANVGRAAIWLPSFGDRGYKFRVFALIDTGGMRGVLARLLAGVGHLEGYHKTEYVGATLHGFSMGNGQGVWCAETRGLIAVALDPVSVQGFLLRAAVARPGPAPAGGRNVLAVDVDCRAFLDMLMLATGHWDRDDLLIISTLLDLPAWRWVRATYDGERLEASLELDPRSPLARALRQPESPPRLMRAIPEGCGLALVAGLEDAGVGWDYVRSAVSLASKMHRPGHEVDLAEELRGELGIDVAEGIFANLRAGAVIVPKLERLRDVEDRSVLVFDVADGPAARAAIEALVAFAADDVEVRVDKDATTWRDPRGRGGIAIMGTTVVVATGRDSPLDATLDQLRGGPSELARSLRDAHPSATAFAAVNFDGFGRGDVRVDAGLLAGLGRRSLGVSFRDSFLRATADVGAPEIARVVLDVAQAQRARMARRRCMSGLRRVYIAAYRHAAAKGGFPERLEEMQEYLRGATATCAASGEPFVYRSELAGRRTRDFPDRAGVIVAHDPPGAHADGGAVVYLSGRAEWLSRERFLEVIAELERGPRRAPGREEPNPEPVF